MKNNQDFLGLLNRDQCQVFCFSCPSSIPFNFAPHLWFVINKRGLISRWEVLFRKTKYETSWGHLYMNFFPPFQGIETVLFSKKLFWKGKMLGHVEGDTAKRTADFIEDSPTKYPYRDEYFLTGPNSNTYAQWVLNSFPEFEVKLPWNSFGKNYKIK